MENDAGYAKRDLNIHSPRMGRAFAISGRRGRLLGCGTFDHGKGDKRGDVEARTPNFASCWPEKDQDVSTSSLDSSSG
jgi:hypothetical protein